METNITNANSPLVPVVLTTGRVNLSNLNPIQNPGKLINVNGTVYFDGNGELYKLDKNDQPVLVGEINTSSNGSTLGTFTNVKGIFYFIAYDNDIKPGLYRIDPATGLPSRIGNPIISTGGTQQGTSANIVNLGDSDYFLANKGDRQLWKIDRASGVVAKVVPNGLPAKF